MTDKENTEPPIIESEGITPELRRSERYINIYTNQIEIGFSPWDIQLSLMQVHGRAADSMAEELATVTMSPQHAKAVIFPLLKTIMQYEEQHGVITLPTNRMSVSIFDMLRNNIQQALDKAKEAEQTAETDR